ncbi:MAG: hypothetical protein ABI955_05105, partial [Nitrospirota bacterium]
DFFCDRIGLTLNRVRIHHTAISGLLFLSAMAMQGCVALVWLGTVGIDRTRTSDIEFQSFENSWVVAPQERQTPGLVKSIAVTPFVGDSVMAERWTVVFREMTDLRVVSESDATRYGISDHGQIRLTQQMSAEFQVDCVLFGNVAGQDPQKSFAGLKERSSWRLSLQLVSADGTLMWKTELPYTIVKGAKDLDEEMVMKTLLTHVRAHVNELGLAELGASSMQAVVRASRDTPDNQMGRLLPRLENP